MYRAKKDGEAIHWKMDTAVPRLISTARPSSYGLETSLGSLKSKKYGLRLEVRKKPGEHQYGNLPLPG